MMHLQYLAWPDMNVPDDPRGVVGLIQEVERAVEETGSAGGESAEPRRSCGNDSDPATHFSTIRLPCSPSIHLHRSRDTADALPSIQDWPVASAQSAGCSQGQAEAGHISVWRSRLTTDSPVNASSGARVGSQHHLRASRKWRFEDG
jgi:hypothetical protein